MSTAWLETKKVGRKTHYRLRWFTDGKKRSKSVGAVRPIAQKKLLDFQNQLDVEAVAKGKQGWLDYVDYDLAQYETNHAKGSWTLLERTYRLFSDLCDPKTVDEVDFEMVEAFRKVRLGSGVSAATVNIDLRNLRGGLYRAVDRGMLVATLTRKQWRKLFARESEPVPAMLDASEFETLLAACPTTDWKGICLVAYLAGLRLGEILALEWKDVDFTNGILHVRNKSFHKTKSRKNRQIPMDPRLKTFLQKHNGDPESRLCFISTSLKENRAERIASASSAFAEICCRAGLVEDRGDGGEKGGERHRHRYTMHDLRRTCITEWFGVMDPKSVQTLAGHQDVRTTMRHYSAVQDRNLVAGINRRAISSHSSAISEKKNAPNVAGNVNGGG